MSFFGKAQSSSEKRDDYKKMKIGVEKISEKKAEATTKQKFTYEELMKLDDIPAVNIQEEAIKEDIEFYKFNENETKDVFIRALASAQIQIHCEVLYSSIFGGQLEILKYLENKIGGDTYESLSSFYNNALMRYPKLSEISSVTKYINFLVSMKTIVPSDTNYIITEYGKAFLTYLRNWNLFSIERPY